MAQRDEMAMIADRWMLSSRRIVNWGSYEGYHEFKPSMDRTMPVTLLAGASESGKSTLVDAQISLLYPTGTPFNKASNSGRSERSDYTYLRGMLGYGDGDEPIFLRGRDGNGAPQSVWGAIVDVYSNRTTGQTLSCGKFLYLTAGDGSGDVRRQYAVWDRPLDPRTMDRFREAPFTPAQLKAAYPGCATFPNAAAFHAHIWGVMGLSEGACRLLHKIQSADAPSRLDDIFKQGVLGVPDALELARAAVDDWDRYDENFRAMEEKAKRIARLTDIQTRYGDYADAVAHLRAYDPVDPSGETGKSAIRAWAFERMAGEVRDRLPLDEAEASRLADAERIAARKADDLRDRLVQIEAQLQGHDGGNLARLETQLAQENRLLEETRAQRDRMAARFRDAGEPMPADGTAWQEARSRMTTDTADADRRMDELEAERDAAVGQRSQADRDLKTLKRDYERQSRQRTRISQSMDEARALLAKATGLTTDELPYAAELMDVREDAEEWRAAMNVVYGQLAQTILVDKRHERGFARKVSAIDPKLMTRRTWTFVDTDARYEDEPYDGWMSGKLRYREDSPFVGWLRSQTCSERLDAECVDAIDDADRQTRQVQRDGQLKSGTRGWHGTKGIAAVIGFANETYLADLRAQADDAQRRLQDADGRYRDAKAAIETLHAVRELAGALAYTPWDKVDVEAAQTRVADVEERIDAVRNDPELADLLDMKRESAERMTAAQTEASRLALSRTAAERTIDAEREWLEAHGTGAADGTAAADESAGRDPLRDVADDLAQAYERNFAGVLRPEDRAHVIVSAANAGDGTTERFADRAVAAIGTAIGQRIAALRSQADAVRAAVESKMADYIEWYAPDDDALTASVKDYKYYLDELKSLARLTAVNATDDEYANCLDKMLMDFTQLGRAIDTDARGIGEQLERINAMLDGQSFGPRHGRLSIGADVRAPETAFSGLLRRTMRMLADWKAGRGGAGTGAVAGAAADHTDARDARQAFAKCKGLVDRLREELDQVRDANGIKSYGARNLDPRCRSRFYATVHHASGPDERITSTGGKSGGALQELTSFVYGAALIYLLGGDVIGRPTYTTLFLDEALIKADGRYTQRALSVLPRLGFQVIVSAPESKTAEILEVATKAYVARRDPDTNLSDLREVVLDGLDEDYPEEDGPDSPKEDGPDGTMQGTDHSGHPGAEQSAPVRSKEV